MNLDLHTPDSLLLLDDFDLDELEGRVEFKVWADSAEEQGVVLEVDDGCVEIEG